MAMRMGIQINRIFINSRDDYVDKESHYNWIEWPIFYGALWTKIKKIMHPICRFLLYLKI